MNRHELISGVSAEKLRANTEAAIAAQPSLVQPSPELELQHLEGCIITTAMDNRQLIDTTLAIAAKEGKRYSQYTYTERISASRLSPDEIAFVEAAADEVAGILSASLEADGYSVSFRSKEVMDYRDSVGAPPEYYDNVFDIRW